MSRMLSRPLVLQILAQVTSRSCHCLPHRVHSYSQTVSLTCRRESLNSRNTCSATVATGSEVAVDPRARAILEYWLGEGYREHPPNHMDSARQKLWFSGGAAVDKDVRERFGRIIDAAASGQLPEWSHGYEALAGIILRDQLTRNMYRGSPKMFSLDSEALDLAKSLVSNGEATRILPPHRVWLFMPFMHSELLEDQQAGVRHFQELQAECEALPGGGEPLTSAVADNVRYARAHEDVIRRWGRFPHRNALLGRECTPEEAAGLEEGTIASF